MSVSGSRNLIVVLGMHRSGTSALAGMLGNLDLELGTSLMHPSPYNPKGYFENTHVVAASDEMLRLLDVSWADAYRMPIGGNSQKIPASMRKNIIRTLSRDFSSDKPLLIKDPRMCTLLPVWKDIFKEMGWKTHYLVIWRDPQAVAESLKTRDMIPYSRSLKLWLHHNLCAEFYTRREQRCFISFKDMLDSPARTLTQIRTFLPFLGSGNAGSNDAPAFVDKKLTHFRTGEKSSLLPVLVKELNELLHAAVQDLPENFGKAADEIRFAAEEERFFRSPQSEPYEAMLQVKMHDGSEKKEYFRVANGPVHMEMICGPGAAARKIILHPSNDRCILKIKSFQLILSNGDHHDQEKFAGNAKKQQNGSYLFRNSLPYLYFYVPEGLIIDRIEVEADYLSNGELEQEKFLQEEMKKPHILYILRSFPWVALRNQK